MREVEMWCSNCGHRFKHQASEPATHCPECDGDCLVSAAEATTCSRQEPVPCNRPAVNPEKGLHMCNPCGTAYIHGF